MLSTGLHFASESTGPASVQMVGPYAAINRIVVGNQRRPSNTGYECD